MHAQLGPPLSYWNMSYNSATSAFHFPPKMRNGISAVPQIHRKAPSKSAANAAVGLLKTIQMFPNHSCSPCTRLTSPIHFRSGCQNILSSARPKLHSLLPKSLWTPSLVLKLWNLAFKVNMFIFEENLAWTGWLKCNN